MLPLKEIKVEIDQLLLDPNNYRFRSPQGDKEVAENRIAESRVQASARDQLNRQSLGSLKNSIRENGFVPVEKIVVRPHLANVLEVEQQPCYVVVEGNRRTAALKELYDDYKRGVDLRDDLVDTFSSLPVLLAAETKEDDVLALMGIRHVGGPKEWDGYQSALLVKELVSRAAEDNNPSKTVADKLGLSVREVNRRLGAFSLLEQFLGSEEFGEFARSSHYPIFHEVAASPIVRDWMGYSKEEQELKNETNRDLFYSWISEENGDPKISSYEEIRRFQSVIQNPDALAALVEDDQSLSDAYAITQSEAKAKRWESNVKAALKSLEEIPPKIMKQLSNEQIELLKNVSEASQDIVSAATAMKKKES